MKALIDKVQTYSHAQRIERLIKIGVANSYNQATPTELIEMELIQAIRSENGEIAQVKKMREITDRMDAEELANERHRHDKRYQTPFEDDGAYAD